MQCPHCDSLDTHGPSHDFYGTVCVDCGETLVMDKTQSLDRDIIAKTIIDSIYDGDMSYMDVAVACADDIIRSLTSKVQP